jgi:hypothetical protein
VSGQDGPGNEQRIDSAAMISETEESLVDSVHLRSAVLSDYGTTKLSDGAIAGGWNGVDRWRPEKKARTR